MLLYFYSNTFFLLWFGFVAASWYSRVSPFARAEGTELK